MNIETAQKKKKWYRPSNILFYLVMLIGLSAIIFPDVKAFLINGLMKVGLFQPSVPDKQSQAPTVNLFSHQDLGFRNEQGAHIDVATLKGKVVVLNFWATWCPPCRAELPSMKEFYNQWKSDTSVVLLMIDADSKVKESTIFLRQKGYDMTNVMSWTSFHPSIFGGSLPTTVVFDRKGGLAYAHTGAMDFNSSKFNSFIASLK